MRPQSASEYHTYGCQRESLTVFLVRSLKNNRGGFWLAGMASDVCSHCLQPGRAELRKKRTVLIGTMWINQKPRVLYPKRGPRDKWLDLSFSCFKNVKSWMVNFMTKYSVYNMLRASIYSRYKWTHSSLFHRIYNADRNVPNWESKILDPHYCFPTN